VDLLSRIHDEREVAESRRLGGGKLIT